MGLLIALIAIGVFMVTTQNYFCKNLFHNRSDNFAYSLILYVIALITTFFLNGATINAVSSFTALNGIIYGLLLILELTCTLQAYKYGPMSLTTLIVVAATIIPCIPSWIFWGDPITWNQIAGMVVMLTAIALILNVFSTVKGEQINLKWAVYAFLAFIGSGCAAICEKLMTATGNDAQTNEFILIGFAAGIAAMIVALMITHRKEPVTIKPSLRLAVPTLLIGVCTCIASVITVAVLALLPVSVVFMINNGARLVIVTVIDILFFKEKIKKSQYAGLVLGILGIVLLSI